MFGRKPREIKPDPAIESTGDTINIPLRSHRSLHYGSMWDVMFGPPLSLEDQALKAQTRCDNAEADLFREQARELKFKNDDEQEYREDLKKKEQAKADAKLKKALKIPGMSEDEVREALYRSDVI